MSYLEYSRCDHVKETLWFVIPISVSDGYMYTANDLEILMGQRQPTLTSVHDTTRPSDDTEKKFMLLSKSAFCQRTLG